MSRQKRVLTPYGRWIKIRLLEKDMTVSELSEKTGVVRQRITDVMYGVLPGKKYKRAIESALGEYKESELSQVG